MLDSLEHEVEMLDRHLEILCLVINNEPIGMIKLSKQTGYPRYKIQYSFRALERSDLIEPTHNGATTTEQTAEFVETLDDDIDTNIRKLHAMKADPPAKIEASVGTNLKWLN